jgi:hypothetical protein
MTNELEESYFWTTSTDVLLHRGVARMSARVSNRSKIAFFFRQCLTCTPALTKLMLVYVDENQI